MSEKRTAYWQKLQDPRWQKVRLLVFERDGFECGWCPETSKRLEVHHLYYISGREPWEYPLSAFETLCCDCHKLAKGYAKEIHSWELFKSQSDAADKLWSGFGGQFSEELEYYCKEQKESPGEVLRLLTIALNPVRPLITKAVLSGWRQHINDLVAYIESYDAAEPKIAEGCRP